MIDDGFVSGSHAEITFDHGDWWLQDLHSTNGTFIAGKRLEPDAATRLNNGAEVLLGSLLVQVVFE